MIVLFKDQNLEVKGEGVMKIGRYTLCDKYGWPIESVRGKHFNNWIRAIIWTSLRRTIESKQPDLAEVSKSDGVTTVERDNAMGENTISGKTEYLKTD